jgi:hypothetical protein
MIVDPGVEFKPVECDSPPADRNFRQPRADLGVEAVLVHPEVFRDVAQTNQPGIHRFVTPASRALLLMVVFME